MDKDRLTRLAKNPNLIEGIHNYCDRWCERCAFTAKCLNYAIHQEEFPDEGSRDISNSAYWDRFAEFFHEMVQMVREDAAERGINVDDIDEEILAEDKELTARAENHPCCEDSREYARTVNAWFDSADDLFSDKKDELTSAALMDLPDGDPVAAAQELNDAVDVIRWYQHQIYVKLIRAVRGMMRDSADIEYMPDDSNGSAKVALIGMDRSIGAWGVLYDAFDEWRDEILDILVTLECLRKKTERYFPEARCFVRPGLDETGRSDE